MKLQISYNFPDLTHALDIAKQTFEYADILGIGSLLIFKEGVAAIKAFKKAFPDKELFVEAKIIEKADEAVSMFAQVGANYVSVMAGSYHSTIKKASEIAKSFDIKIALDLLDAHSPGQSAADAKTLGLNCILMHRIPSGGEVLDLQSDWRNVRDNTALPIFVNGKIDEANFDQIISLKPQGVIIGSAITKSGTPAKVAKYFKSLV
jgi:3-hexulose-6-phosphate synthase